MDSKQDRDPKTPSRSIHPFDVADQIASGIDRGLLELVNDLVLSLSLDGTQLIYVNRAAEKIYGRHLSEIYNNSTRWIDAIHPDDQVALREGLANITETNNFEHEFRVFKPDGNQSYLKGAFSLMRDVDGTPSTIGGIAKDISKRVDTEQRLDEAKAIYHSLVESLPINVFRKDRQGRIIFGNQKYCSSFGLPSEDVLGKTDHDLFDHKWADKYQKDDHWVLQTGLPFHDIEHHPDPDGEVRYVEVLKAPVTDGDGRRIGIQGMYWDVTARKQAEIAIEKARDLAEAASQAKSDFLANVSHEIRTPMNAIIGMTSLLLDSPVDREQYGFLSMIQQSSESLLGLINDILDFSKIESGKLSIETSKFDLRDLLGDTMRTLAYRADKKEIELLVNFDPAIPDSLIGDIGRIRQVIVNLVGNAVKFTSEGHVSVDVGCQDIDSARVRLDFSVTDTGIGIPEEKITKIFKEFEQADTSITRNYGGTGLGLAIASRLVELMGGELEVSSEPGKGSRFYFSVELPADKASQKPPRSLAGFSVLVVTESRLQMTQLCNLLKNWEMTTFESTSVEQAIRTLRGLASAEQPIDVVVSDSQFSKEDGSVLATHVANDPLINSTFVVLLTVSNASEMTFSSDEYAIEDQLLKPVKESELFGALNRTLNAIAQDTTIGSSKRHIGQGTRSLHVLVAEDNVVNQKLAVALLKKKGHRVSVASDGVEAVDLVASNRFDVILMDVQMPRLDGLEATREIRKNEPTNRRTPIIALTAHAGSEDRDKCLASGMDRFVSKPIRIDSLFKVIYEVVGYTPDPIDKIVFDDREEIGKHVDWNSAFETVGGDKKLLLELITVFLDEQAEMIEDIQRAIDEESANDVRRSSHSLKGALTHLGATKAAHLARELEEMGQEKQLVQAQPALATLRKCVKELTRELERFKTSGRE